MTDELKMKTSGDERMTIGAGGILGNTSLGMMSTIPSKQIAEQAIAGLAEMVRELNELRQFKSTEPYSKHLDQGVHTDIGDPEVHVPQGLWHSMREELEALRAKVAYLEPALESAEGRRDDYLERVYHLNHKWESIPWNTLNHCLLILRRYNRLIQSDDVENRLDEAWTWLTANTPKPKATE